jgi:transposase-like protein
MSLPVDWMRVIVLCPLARAMTELINLSSLVDNAKWFELVRQHRWPEAVRCPKCASAEVVRNGRDDTQPHRQRDLCRSCRDRFANLTSTVLAGHHPLLRLWLLCPYLIGLNLSNRQIAQELGVDENEAATASVRPTSIPWRASGPSCAPGCDRTVASPR